MPNNRKEHKSHVRDPDSDRNSDRLRGDGKIKILLPCRSASVGHVGAAYAIWYAIWLCRISGPPIYATRLFSSSLPFLPNDPYTSASHFHRLNRLIHGE